MMIAHGGIYLSVQAELIGCHGRKAKQSVMALSTDAGLKGASFLEKNVNSQPILGQAM